MNALVVNGLLAYFTCVFTHRDATVERTDYFTSGPRRGEWMGERQRCNTCRRVFYVDGGPR
jgi:hypothetical protein